MTKKQMTVLSVLALPWAILGGWQPGSSTSAKASESSAASAVHEQTASTDPKAATWEYRILIAPLSRGVKKIVDYERNGALRAGLPPYSFEDEINRLAAQGFVVESFQTPSSIGDSDRSAGSSNVEIVVLLKRMKK